MVNYEMEANGPIRGDWPNFSALSGNRYHCHLKKGRPTYVAIWELISFHPEMALLGDLYVNLRDFLCDIHCVCLRAIP